MKYTVPLRFNYEFGRVYKRGRYIPGRYCVLHFLRNGKDLNRLGITTGKKVKGSVRRNRVRRLMRESFRLNETRIKPGFDIVLLGRDIPEALTCDIMESDVISLMRRAGIWKEESETAGGSKNDEESFHSVDPLL